MTRLHKHTFNYTNSLPIWIMFKKHKNILWTYWFCSLSKFFWIKSLLKPQNLTGKTHTYVHQVLIKGPTKPVSKCILKQSRSFFNECFWKYLLNLNIILYIQTSKSMQVPFFMQNMYYAEWICTVRKDLCVILLNLCTLWFLL